MGYINDLIEHGTNFMVRRGEDTVSFRPTSGRDEDLEAFQAVVRQLRRHEGDGYTIHIEHQLSDRGTSFTDLVVVRLEP